MSLFDKSLNIGANAAKKVFTKAEPKFRFGGWQALGAQKRICLTFTGHCLIK